MEVEELVKYGIGKEWIERIVEKEKIKNLYDYQAEIIKKKLLDDSLIISAPTASGKTLLAILKMIKALKKGKVIYFVPLVALGVEKYEEFKKFFKGKYKVALSVGDFDSTDPWLKDYDVIVATVEKLDSLLRHGVDWIEEVKLIVVDEIHLLTDASRGPTVEVLLTKLKKILKNVQIIGLSATISNAEELANWLDCKVYKTNFRPVKLYQGVAYDSKIHFVDREDYELGEGEIEEEIARSTLDLNKQLLFFVSTRRRTEALAERLGKIVKQRLSKLTLKQLDDVATQVENVLEVPTKQCKKLARCIRAGVAFHHAGLLAKQKRLIEENFRKGLIKVIVATTTLAAGINTPAFRVAIRDVKRYYPGLGAVYIPVLEYQQMVGRAGRPGYHSTGEAILLAKTEDEAEEFINRYIMGEAEPITSKLASEPALRMHTLALIATNFCKTERSLKQFFDSTFFAYHYGDIYLIEEKIERILDQLEEWKFIKRNKGFTATRIGKRVVELYLDPLTAWWFVQGLEKKASVFGYLQLISQSLEMRPLPNVSTSDMVEIEQLINNRLDEFLVKVPEEYDLEYEDFVKSVKLTSILEDWMNEATEEQLLEKYRTTPGELHARLQIADWLVYALQELALLLKQKEKAKIIRKIRVRLKYGVKEELLPLVRLEGIGRVRARKLYNAGIKTLSDLKKISYESLSRLIGPKVARKIKDQVEGRKEKKVRQATLA